VRPVWRSVPPGVAKRAACVAQRTACVARSAACVARSVACVAQPVWLGSGPVWSDPETLIPNLSLRPSVCTKSVCAVYCVFASIDTPGSHIPTKQTRTPEPITIHYIMGYFQPILARLLGTPATFEPGAGVPSSAVLYRYNRVLYRYLPVNTDT
jgi:hypothetical protein